MPSTSTSSDVTTRAEKTQRDNVRFSDRAQRFVTNRRVFPALAALTALLAVGAGFLVTVIDHRDFHTFGDGIWWAIVTLGTVGYGDIVPHSAWGRVVGSLVIVVGVTFISVLTATVTSFFVSAEQETQTAKSVETREASEEETRALLRLLIERVGVIEERLAHLPKEEPRR
jgi:voltage-gated potassium channel